MARGRTYAPTTPLNQGQLNASSTAAVKFGVPLNIVRSVTMFKYGPRASPADFNYVSQQLHNWYGHFRNQYPAIQAWQHAAAQEMGPTASPLDVARATSNQSAANTSVALAPYFGTLGALLGRIPAAISGTTDAGIDAATADTTGVPSAADAAATGADSAAASGTGAAAGASAGGGFSKILGSITGPVAALALIAWIFNPKNVLRAVEFLTGLAVIIFGLHITLSARTSTRQQRKAFGRKVLRTSPLGRAVTNKPRAR